MQGIRVLKFINQKISISFGNPRQHLRMIHQTQSPQLQIMVALREQKEAVLSRPGIRDWIYAGDVAEAVMLLVEAAKPNHNLYNISTGHEWSALQWGQALAALHPGFVCRLTDAGEVATVDLHSSADRAPLSVGRMADEFGWRARFGCADSAPDLSHWWTAGIEGET